MNFNPFNPENFDQYKEALIERLTRRDLDEQTQIIDVARIALTMLRKTDEAALRESIEYELKVCNSEFVPRS